MKSNLSILVIVLFIVLLTVQTGVAAVMVSDVNDIIKVLPVEFAEYQKQLTGKESVHDCNAILSLVSKAKILRDEPLKNAKEKEDRNRAYCAVWRFALQMRQHSKDSAVQKRIIEEWNKALKKDDEAVPFQIYALSDIIWNREFLTDDFWELLQKTHREKTISAFCFVLHYRGNDADIKQLEQKKQSENNPELRRIIQNALNWRTSRLNGDRASRPAAAPPRRDMKGEN